MTNPEKPGPIEVWLTQRNMEIECRVVHENESTEQLDVESLSMRGAQREMTGWFIAQGYTPAGRWETTWQDGDSGAMETVRRFQGSGDREGVTV